MSDQVGNQNVCFLMMRLIYHKLLKAWNFQNNLFTGDRSQTKQFLFPADCLVVGESQSSSWRSARKYLVKPWLTIATLKVTVKLQEQLNSFSNYQQCLLISQVGFGPARQRYPASQKPTTLPTELSGHP